MTKLSLDAEPPSKFEGKKDVNKKRNGNIPQLIVFLRAEKNKNKISVAKNLEKKVTSDRQKNILDAGYLKSEGIYIEDHFTLTNDSVEFSNQNASSNKSMLNSNYTQKEKNAEFIKENFSDFYDINSQYSFIPKIKEEDKKEDLSSQSGEQENKEIIYAVYNFDETTTSGN